MLYGQGPLIEKNNYYSIGEEYLYYNKYVANININNYSGENIQWDFSNIIFNLNDLRDTIKIINPEKTPFYSDPRVNYSISNLCLHYTRSNNYEYYRLTDTTSEFLGSWEDSEVNEMLYYSFNDPRIEMFFPISYLGTYKDTFQAKYLDISGSGFHKQYGSIINTADAYGNLMINGSDSYLNVLRLKQIITITDTSEGFGVQNYNIVFYYWYSLNYNGVLLKFFLRDDKIISADYYKLLNISGVIENISDNKDIIQFYPNPVSSYGYINVNYYVKENLDLKIYDVLGRIVLEYSNIYQNKQPINFFALPSGYYFIQVLRQGKVIDAKKIIKIK